MNRDTKSLFDTGLRGLTTLLLVLAGGHALPALADCSDPDDLAAAMQPGPTTVADDCVLNPVNGEPATVVQIIVDDQGLPTYAFTDAGDLILMRFEVDDRIACVEPDEGTQACDVYIVREQNINPTTMLVDTVQLQLEQPVDPDNPDAPQPPINTEMLVQSDGGALDQEADANAETPGDPAVPVEQDLNARGRIDEQATGAGGRNGAVAYGVDICFPFIGCVTVGRRGSDGGRGAAGPDLNFDVGETHGDIRTTGSGEDGIRLVSTGGRGGTGSSTVVSSFGPYDGGDGGDGGDIDLTNRVAITTTMDNSHGIAVLSRSGRGGDGGDSILGTGGGGAGGGTAGGVVMVENAGAILTEGDNSHGILAQSVGGSSGNGGDSWGIVGRSGSGTSGGAGGAVTVNNDGVIQTLGAGSHGILAQSIGGTGGDGGNSTGIIALGDQGDGEDDNPGGSAGAVTITNGATGAIETAGDFSVGVLGQSIGGGGGNSGRATGIVVLGSNSSEGGSGDAVDITNEAGAQIATAGVESHAILAQSIGGGGGNAGGVTGLVAIGGEAGSGSDGGSVEVTNAGSISTAGDGARGIFSQSIGGGGGTGSRANGAVAIGGTGGASSLGLDVTVSNSGDIVTLGDRAVAIQAQSIGGGGGDGGSTTGSFTIGGLASAGGDANTVSVTHSGRISTGGSGGGDDAIGILAESIGGGGGNGGSSVSGGFVAGSSIGGLGGGGGDGGEVVVTLASADASAPAAVETNGDRAIGILAQSVGGSGGNGGAAAQTTASSVLAVSTAIGGDGSGGGDGNTATLNGSGTISTRGNSATGVLLQSVGGGGGNGGTTVASSAQAGALGASAAITVGASGGTGGIGGSVNSDFAGAITTTGDASLAFIAQSVGGGGGNGGTTVGSALNVSAGGGAAASTAIGGSGGTGGDGGIVNVTLGDDASDTLRTQGAQSGGVLIQSVGGGGGNGGLTVAGAVSGSAGIDGAISTAIGGDGGGAGIGREVTAVIGSNVITQGDLSTAITVQSVGGGGGNGGTAVAAGAALSGVGSLSVSTALGGAAGGGGNGGDATATIGGDDANQIETSGVRSTAVLVQSIGGGGGNGGTSVGAGLSVGVGTIGGAISTSIGGSGGQGGDGALADASVASNIVTNGESADGVIVQSIGGGGGNGGVSVAPAIGGGGAGGAAVSTSLGGSGDAGGNGGVATLDFDGSVETRGANSTGLLVQSVGGGGGNGGGSVSASLAVGGVAGLSVSTSIGGSGGGGGDGGQDDLTDPVAPDLLPELYAVNLSADGDVTTRGSNSSGILSQSIGGGGGNGGYAIAASGAIGGNALAVAIGIGGAGEGGGDGKDVSSLSFADVQTFGDDSAAITAQSIGGGGGNGGYNVSAALSGSVGGSGAVSVGVGGSGGGAGDGGKVLSISNGTITTSGDRSVGFLTQSVGGGGGNGGASIAANGSVGTGVSAALSVAVGGSGAGGGAGALVDAQSRGDIVTLGEQSVGVLAQSVGGGGGNGGMSIAGSLSLAGGGGGGGAIGIGGSGAGGGNGGLVRLSVDNDVVTTGTNSSAVIAQSVGGGGGNGGLAIGIGASGTGSVSLAAGVGIGGSGDGGGNGDATSARVNGTIMTEGNSAVGVLTQSVGGGGGNGGIGIGGAVSVGSSGSSGSGAVSVGVGGSGGGGGDGGAVLSDVSGYVQTRGDNSVGVLTQSVGGGGGNGATAVGASLSGGTTSGAVAVAVGGSGDTGGDSVAATSTLTAGVVTTGNRSNAVMTQSVAGGGGNGGVSVAGAVSLSQGSGGALAVGVGGFGAAGGNAGDVESIVETTLDNSQIATMGDESTAIVAQSIGGGGGNGGLNVSAAVNMSSSSGAAVGVGIGGFGGGGGDAGNVVLDVSADVVTEGSDSHGLMAQSLGGGGGNGGINVTGALNMTSTGSGASAAVGVGGFGGTGGIAGNVDVDFAGALVARAGADDSPGSHGIIAQSIGGGGGNGGVNVAAGLSFTSSTGAGDGNALLVGIGGFGGGGQSAGMVDVFVADGSSISANGDERSSIFAQSVGGGGGNGGVNVSQGIASDAALVFGMGGFGGAGGAAQTVTVNSGADLFTNGREAHGIFAQSLGGGGGNGGLNVSGALTFSEQTSVPTLTFGMGGFGGDGNISALVDVTQRGTVVTQGDQAHGIFAQSLAGGGGNGGVNISNALNFSGATENGAYQSLSMVVGIGGHGGLGANAGNASVTSFGDLFTSGHGARGILAQSIGGGGGNGGLNFSGNVAKRSSLVTMGIGGFGAGAGNAGSATVLRGDENEAAGMIVTDGVGAIGIEATSIGGGGGNAGANIVAALVLAEEGTDEPAADDEDRERPRHSGVDDEVFTNYDAVIAELNGRNATEDSEPAENDSSQSRYAVQVAIGGAGGGAGNGAEARVDNYGDIATLQERSHGILAQSIGGGGGNAALNVALTFLDEDAEHRGLNLSLGGATGDGGIGGAVNVVHDGAIETLANDSYGILAQSIGGGGGNVGATIDVEEAADGDLSISLGRRGGVGGQGGAVDVIANGSIVTRGDRSWGVLAQSLGNGGGNSGVTSIAGSTDSDASMNFSFGLEGADGGDGGAASIDVQGLVVTEGTDAHAVFAQSVGGGGGNAGDIGSDAASIAFSLGGDGGIGGIGGMVDITSGAEVMTTGTGAIGIFAQSIGGGGGNGGKSEAETDGSDASLAINLGGSGGDGARGGTVEIDNTGVVMTRGDNAHAIFAQSLGGGGGNAGMTVTTFGSSGNDESGSTQLAMNVGGSGGDGAEGNVVTVINSGSVQTEGARAAGIYAQSVGGGGGNANQVITALLDAGVTVSLGLGGNGGEGGAGNDVTVDNIVDAAGNVGRIVTTGDSAHGIVAMSIGGGGGNGANVISMVADEDLDEDSSDTQASSATSMNIGGSGGMGGVSGLVTVNNDGEIVTLGRQSHGVFAQSIGGGGGNGGIVFVQGNDSLAAIASVDQNISIGGNGGEGNLSGDVIVNNSGAIDVAGDGAYGVFAQSIGGGGGNGGAAGMVLASNDAAANSDDSNVPSLPSLTNFSLGGTGGQGADSGDVTVTHTGSIVARGDNAYGIYAQTIAGGGGTMGASYDILAGSAVDVLAPILVGSRDGGSGAAGSVTVNSTGDVIMLGANSQAWNVQSVNGGGGDLQLQLVANESDTPGDDTTITSDVVIGSASVEEGRGSDVAGDHTGNLMTLGRNASGSTTQSIGGGGGTGQIDVVASNDTSVEITAVLGGSDSANSGGGNLEMTRDGDVMTAGANAPATIVQSIGGGGGTLVIDVASQDAGDDLKPDPSQGGTDSSLIKLAEATTETGDGQATQAAGSSATIGLGASAGLTNDGGTLDLTYDGDLLTQGERAPALLAQSIGGGGGDARLLGLDAVSVSFGGESAASGSGGDIMLTNTGDIMTIGELSHGVVLQSIGGGGGLVLTDLEASTVAWTLRDSNQGSGGDILFNQVGDILTRGDQSIALAVQSLGGGGGMLDRVFSGTAGGAGSGGDITVTLDGSLMAMGDNGIGLFAQSDGTDGQGDIDITLQSEHFIFAGDNGTAVWLSGGEQNRLANFGTIATNDGIDGLAIRTDGGALTISNAGTVVGSLALTGNNNRFVNSDAARLTAGANVDLGGAASLLNNDGLWSSGDSGYALTTNLNGGFQQSETGSVLADIDFANGNVDQVFATGSANLNGTIRTQLLNTAVIAAGSFSQTLVRADGGLINDGVVLDALPSVVVQQNMRYTANEAILDYDVDFSAAGLDANLAAVGTYLNDVQNAGGGNAAYGDVISKLVTDPDLDTYRHSLSQLSPDFYAEHQVQLINSSLDFADRMMGCQRDSGGRREITESRCVWAQVDQFSTRNDAARDYKAMDGTTGRYSLGGQTLLGSDWSLGFSLSRESNNSDGYDGRWRSRSETNQWGLMASRRSERTLWSGGVSYGKSRAVSNRQGALVNTFGTLAEREMDTLLGQWQVSHRVPMQDWYWQPSLGAGFVELRSRASQEAGATALDLQFLDDDETHTWIRPALEVGRTLKVGENSALTMSLELSAIEFLSGSTTNINARLAGAPTTVAPMVVGSELPDSMLRTRFGIDFRGSSNMRTRFFIDSGNQGRNQQDSVNLRFELPLR